MLDFQKNSPVLTLLRPDSFAEKLTVCIGCIATIYLLCHADWWMGVVLINLLWQLVFSVNFPQSFISNVWVKKTWTNRSIDTLLQLVQVFLTQTLYPSKTKNLAFFFIFQPFSNFSCFSHLNITQHADAEDWFIFGHTINWIKIFVKKYLTKEH